MATAADRAVIVGGGLHGCAVGLFLARAGWQVTILEKNLAGRHASGVNAGGLRLLMRDWREYPLAELALAHWSRLAGIIGDRAAAACEVRLATHQIAIALDTAELGWAEARARESARRGIGAECLLSRQEVRALLPGVSPAVLGGIVSHPDGHANPAGAALGFRSAARDAGATLVENCRVLGLERTGGGTWKVLTPRGRFDGDVVVNCAGAWGARVAALVDEDLPCAVTAPSMMVTTRTAPFVTPVVIGIDRPLSFKQSAAGSLVIGGGILGDARPDQDTSHTVMERMVQSAAAAVEAFPCLREVPIVRTWTGLEGRTPDGIPIIGPSRRHDGFWHAFGYCGHGFLLAPAVGEVVARSICSGTLDSRLAPFSPSRFDPAARAS